MLGLDPKCWACSIFMCDKDVVSFTVLGMHCWCGPPSLLCSYGVAASLFYFA